MEHLGARRAPVINEASWRLAVLTVPAARDVTSKRRFLEILTCKGAARFESAVERTLNAPLSHGVFVTLDVLIKYCKEIYKRQQLRIFQEFIVFLLIHRRFVVRSVIKVESRSDCNYT